MVVQVGSILIKAWRLMLSNSESSIMKQKNDSQEKQNASKTGQDESALRLGYGPPACERSEGARKHRPLRSLSLEACVDCATSYDPNVNYATVLASLLSSLQTHKEE